MLKANRQDDTGSQDESQALDEKIVSLSSKSEKSLKQRNVVVEHPTSKSLVTTWLYNNTGSAVFEASAFQADNVQRSPAALPPFVIMSTAVPGTLCSSYSFVYCSVTDFRQTSF